MIHRLFDQGVAEMLARGLPRESDITVLDIGAHSGDFAADFLKVFQSARVHAFEPAPGPLSALAERARLDRRIRPVALALGETDGEATLRETVNPLLTSLLVPFDRLAALSGGASAVVRETVIPVRRLDGWARDEGVVEVGLLKLDVQGSELAVLRGGRGVLERTSAVYVEAAIEPLYQGSSTFAEVDLFLRADGFHLHQILELTTQGSDLQTTQVDALWLKPDVLRVIRESPLERVTPPWATAFVAALERCHRLGAGRVAIYGAGTHSRSIEAWLEARPGVRIEWVIDDRADLRGKEFAGRPIVSVDDAPGLGVEAVILSSDTFEDELWARTAGLRRGGVPVLRLYGREVDLD